MILLDKYATSFGFTEKDVFQTFEDFGYKDKKNISSDLLINSGWHLTRTEDILFR